MDKYDLVVIGGGPGGYPAAIRAAQLGLSTALVEKENLGGTCLNWGCIPTKNIIAAASLYYRATRATPPGLKFSGASFDYAALCRSKDSAVSRLRTGIGALLKSNGVEVFKAEAAFAGRRQVRLHGAGNHPEFIEADYFIVATGTAPAVPPFIPHGERVLDSRAFLALEKLPASLMVLGGGVIGCELGCMAAQFGVEVTLIEILPDILANLDADLRAEVRRSMESKLKIAVLAGQPLENITAGAKGVSGRCGGKAVAADALLCAAGRIPDTSSLGLDKAGIQTDRKGYIPADTDGRTSAPNVFAVGDVNGKFQLAHAATAQGIAAAESAAGVRRPDGRGPVVPACIFTHPEIASAGLTEQEATARKRPVTVAKFPFAALGKAVSAGETGGFVKWICDPDTGRALGAAAAGAHATELIAEAALAIESEQTMDEIARTIHAHPTFAEAWMEAAHLALGHCIHLPPKKLKTGTKEEGTQDKAGNKK